MDLSLKSHISIVLNFAFTLKVLIFAFSNVNGLLKAMVLI